MINAHRIKRPMKKSVSERREILYSTEGTTVLMLEVTQLDEQLIWVVDVATRGQLIWVDDVTIKSRLESFYGPWLDFRTENEMTAYKTENWEMYYYSS